MAGTSSNHPLVSAVWKFLGHAVASSCIFLIVAGVAFAIEKFVHLLQIWGASEVLVKCLIGLEYLVLGVDAISMVFFLVGSLIAVYKEMNHE